MNKFNKMFEAIMENNANQTQFKPTYTYSDDIYTMRLILHPAVKALDKGGELESVELGYEWKDSDKPCYNVTAIIDGKKYELSDWWIDPKGVENYRKAVKGDKQALIAVKKRLQDIATV